MVIIIEKKKFSNEEREAKLTNESNNLLIFC